jgi:MscS family membrane protein
MGVESTTFSARRVTGCFALILVAIFSSLYVQGDVYGAQSVPADAAVSPNTQAVPESDGGKPMLDPSLFLGEWANREIIGKLQIGHILGAFLLILLGLVAKKILDFVLEKKVIPFLKGTRVDFDYLLTTAASKPAGYILLIAGLAGACAALPLNEHAAKLVFGTLKVLVAINVVWFLFRLVDVISEYLAKLTRRTESQLDDQLVPLVSKALKVTVVLVGAVTTLQMLGINVTGLVAGLGIGGLAIALGLQDTMANFFGSVFILIDRPFSVGDWIKIDDVEGTVNEVGFRSTRIETFPKTIVTIPNKTVANATIDNWSRMPKRRVYQTVGVTYETTAEQMEKAVRVVRDIVENDEGVDNEYIVVRFREFSDSSLDIIVYYFTKATAFAEHLETKERINLGIMRAIDDMGLSIAFPTRTVYLEGQVQDKSS